MRRSLALLSSLALAVGIVAVPSMAAGQTTTTMSSFSTTCRIAAPSVAGVGGPMDITPEKQVDIHVTSPEHVTVGEQFRVVFEIDPISVSLDSLPSAVSLQQASRLKLDLQRPAGTRLVDYSLAGGNLDVSKAKILTVDDAGSPKADGSVLRLTDVGHNTVGNGGSASTSSHAGMGMDLRNKTSLDLQFPKVTLTLEAERAGRADVGVRTQGSAAAYGNNPASFLTLLASVGVPLLGTQWAPGYCSPRASATAPIDQRAAVMKSVDIEGVATSTTLTGPENVYLRTPAEFVATVAPAVAGDVTFVSGTQRVTAPVDTATGRATANLTFNTKPDGPVEASFTPADAKYSPSRSELAVDVKALETTLSLDAPATVSANERTAVSATLPADARGTVTFRAGDQERTAEVRNGVATTSMTFSRPGEVALTATYAPSATSPYAAAEATATIDVTKNLATSLVLEGLDAPGYVADPVRLGAVVTPAEGTADTSGTVEFVAGTQRATAAVVDGRASTEFSFGRAGDVDVTATFTPSGAEQTPATDAGTLSVVDAVATSAELVGPTHVAPGTDTPYTIRIAPQGATGTALVRIDGRVVATDVPVVDGEGAVTLAFPPAADEDRAVTVEFTPADPRVLRPSVSEHTVSVAPSPVNTDALSMTVEGPEGRVEARTPFPVSVRLHPQGSDDVAAIDGYLTVTNNGKTVNGTDGQAVRIPVVRGTADANLTFSGATPASKDLVFTFHEADGTERASAPLTVVVAGQDGGDDTSVDPGTGGSGSLDLGSLGDSGSLSDLGGLTGSLGALTQTRN